MKKQYTKEQVEEAIKNSLSIAGACVKLGIKPIGGNYKSFHLLKMKWNVDISHFTGQGWNVGSRFTPVNKFYTFSEILVENSIYTCSKTLKKRLYEAGLKNEQCEECGITSWNNKTITLQLDHINGVHSDNRIENLRILCPNCHSQTDTFCGKNIKANDYKSNQLNEARDKKLFEIAVAKNKLCKLKKDIKIIPSIEELQPLLDLYSYAYIGELYGVTSYVVRRWVNVHGVYKKKAIRKKKVERPTKEELQILINTTPYTLIGEMYNVSNNAVKKWAIAYGIYERKSAIKNVQ